MLKKLINIEKCKGKKKKAQKASINSQEARCCFQELQPAHFSATCQVSIHGDGQSKERYKWANKKEVNGKKKKMRVNPSKR